jgi:hypothetical protein
LGRENGEFNLSDQEVHEGWLKPRLLGYAAALGVTLEVSDIGAFIGADSLGYLSEDGLLAPLAKGDAFFCRACFNGTYPLDVSHMLGKLQLEDNRVEER